MSAVEAALARELGCDTADFHAQALRIVERPPGGREPALALAVECGTGSVISLRDARMVEPVRAAAAQLPAHYRIFLPSFLESVAAIARDVGHPNARTHTPALGLALAELLPVPSLPEGYFLTSLSPGEVAELRAVRAFPNALMEPDDDQMHHLFREAAAIRDASGTAIAAAGIWEMYPGIDEIGLDVHRDHRGRGLARHLTLLMTHRINETGRSPIYTISLANLRSLNNGLACGYRPAWLQAAIYLR
jgi:GNAT superfamily N-acetyltransferase